MVLLYYFGYLRRAPEKGADTFGSTLLTHFDTTDQTAPSLVCAFINSDEYQARFGMHKKHADKECKGGPGS